ncbi:MAG: hypothetical protein E6Q96_05530 [Cyclobacteriaceae bacterium]|nr:MAG: hypothetical protein E6Q96_05530 [Cyclobacteriaceae bacterium]
MLSIRLVHDEEDFLSILLTKAALKSAAALYQSACEENIGNSYFGGVLLIGSLFTFISLISPIFISFTASI